MVYNISGKQIKRITVAGNKGGNHYYIPAADIVAGMYLINTKGRQLNITQKAARQ